MRKSVVGIALMTMLALLTLATALRLLLKAKGRLQPRLLALVVMA